MTTIAAFELFHCNARTALFAQSLFQWPGLSVVSVVFAADGESDWGCGISRFDVSKCEGLRCNETYKATENSLNNAFGKVYFECVKQISYNGLVFNAPNNYFYIPAGCEYNTAWDAQYPCFGGMRWDAFADACPKLCHYTPSEVSAVCNAVSLVPVLDLTLNVEHI